MGIISVSSNFFFTTGKNFWSEIHMCVVASQRNSIKD